MYDEALLTKVNQTLITILLVSAPVLLSAVVIGVLVGLIQALTQIQDQTLPQAIKLIATLLIVLLLGPVFAQTIADQASTALNEFPVVTR